ncbi:major facilitator superfamily domain-containing protein [Pyrenochaeta sp. MPI-SDFR-AT-0127]|nr:major facilitator superfamily domain-containing protein [Pyrenochaeta sp. MPI-SDFR-AT-0127]
MAAEGDITSLGQNSLPTNTSLNVLPPHIDTCDPRHPFNLPAYRKKLILLTGLIAAFNSTLGSSLPSGATTSLSSYFGLPASSISLVLLNSLYIIGFAVSPLIFAPLSEVIGRRPVLIGSYTCYVLFTLGSALAPSFNALLVFRLFAGFSAAVPNTVVGGLFVDIYDGPKASGNAVAWFIFIAVQGTLVGPLASGLISVNMDWRWTFWIGLVIAGIGLPLVWMLPETYAPVLLKNTLEGNNTLRLTELGVRGHLKNAGSILKRPVLMMVREPLLLFTSLYLALVYSMLYLIFQAYPVVYGGIYSLSQDMIGLAYIPIMAGVTGGFLLFYIFGSLYARAVNEGRSWAKVEEYRRLPLACLGGPCITIALLVWSFTASPNIHPAIPMAISGALFGMGYLLTFLAMLVYLSDIYKRYAASAQAAASTTRSIAAIILPFAAPGMYHKLGVKSAGIILAVASGLMAAVPVIFLIFRRKFRATSVFSG